jgi:hypothetical protein
MRQLAGSRVSRVPSQALAATRRKLPVPWLKPMPIAAGATSTHAAASLAAVEFCRANGFQEVGRGEHRLRSGRARAGIGGTE